MTAARAPRLTDSPWFWVHLFAAAALVALFLIGPKADTVQAQRDANFAGRQRSLELQREGGRDQEPGTRVRSEGTGPEWDQEEAAVSNLQPSRFVTFTPFYTLLGIVAVISWVMLWGHIYRQMPVGGAPK